MGRSELAGQVEQRLAAAEAAAAAKEKGEEEGGEQQGKQAAAQPPAAEEPDPKARGLVGRLLPGLLQGVPLRAGLECPAAAGGQPRPAAPHSAPRRLQMPATHAPGPPWPALC